MLQTELEDKLAEEILSGHIAKNSSVRIGVDKDGKTLKFQGRRLPSAGTRHTKKDTEAQQSETAKIETAQAEKK